MIKSFWGGNDNKYEVKLEIEDKIGGVKLTLEELEEYFETLNKKGIKIRGNNIINVNVKCSNVKIGVKKDKK